MLAENVSAPYITIIPRQIKNPQETAEKLASILDMPTDKAYEYVTKNESSVNIHPEGRKINEEQESAIRTLNLDGVYLAKDSKRFYPHDDYLAHVLGFTGIDNQGLMGLELYYDDQLKGKQGNLAYFSDAKQRRIDWLADVYEPPVDGLNLQTTINLDVQSIIERELDIAVAKYNPDGALAISSSRRSEEHTSELQSRGHLVCRLLLEKKNTFK